MDYLIAPQEIWGLPPELGGAVSNFPFLDRSLPHAGWQEVQVSWYGADSGIWQEGGHNRGTDYVTGSYLDREQYTGDIYSDQNRLSPILPFRADVLEQAAVENAYFDSEGINNGTWQYDDWGGAPYG